MIETTASIGPDGVELGRADHAIAYSWRDDDRDEGGWESPDDRDYRLTYVEACARAMRSALAARSATATLTVEAYVRPCELGCMEDDGTPITPGECGEPPSRRFTVTVSDGGFRQSWHVI